MSEMESRVLRSAPKQFRRESFFEMGTRYDPAKGTSDGQDKCHVDGDAPAQYLDARRNAAHCRVVIVEFPHAVHLGRRHGWRRGRGHGGKTLVNKNPVGNEGHKQQR